MPFGMSSFVFWSGIYNAGLALFLLFPPFYGSLGLNFPAPFWAWFIAAFLAYTSVTLVLSSRNLSRRASFVYWEAFLRFIAAFLIIPAGLFGDFGLIAVPLGVVDLCIGLVYMTGLPKELGVSHHALLLDRF